MYRKILVCAVLASLATSGRSEVLVDSGFRPTPHGFGFANWGGDEHPQATLKPDDAAYLFGEQACARIENESCIPTPGARLWLEAMNKSKEGGHCEGMAVLSAAFFIEAESLSDYGGDATQALKPDDEILMRTISAYYSTQMVDPVQTVTNVTKKYSLQKIVDGLIAALKSGEDYPTLGIYDKGGGHAVTPYKIERTGNAVYRVYIYDNNYPGQEKFIDIDAGNDQWVYNGAALNPSEPADAWSGGAGAMDFTLFSTRFEPLKCPFCGPQDQAAAAAESRKPKPSAPTRQPAAPATTYTVVTPTSCDQVQAVGKSNNKQVSSSKNDISGATMKPMRGTRGCVVSLPRDQEYDVRVNPAAGASGTTSLAVFGGTKVFQVDNIAVRPGKVEAVSFSQDEFNFHAGSDQRPVIRFADDNLGEDDSYYEISDFDIGAGHEFSAEEDTKGRIAFSDDDPELDDYDIDAELVGDDDTETFDFDDVGAGDNGELVFDDEGEGLDMDIDSDADGQIDEEDGDDDNDGQGDAADLDDDGDGVGDASDEDFDDEGDESGASDGDVDEGDADSEADLDDGGDDGLKGSAGDADDALGNEDALEDEDSAEGDGETGLDDEPADDSGAFEGEGDEGEAMEDEAAEDEAVEDEAAEDDDAAAEDEFVDGDEDE